MKIQPTVTEHTNRGKPSFRFRFFDTDNVIEKTEDGKKIKAPITVAMSARSYSDDEQARAAMTEFVNAVGTPALQIGLKSIEETVFNKGHDSAREKYMPIIVVAVSVAVVMTIAAGLVLFGWI